MKALSPPASLAQVQLCSCTAATERHRDSLCPSCCRVAAALSVEAALELSHTREVLTLQ